MTRPRWSSLLLLIILVALEAATDPAKNQVKVLRKLMPINSSNANVKQCLWFAMQEYNKASDNKYIFQVIKIVQAQLQVTDSMEYFIDVELALSTCKKPLNNNENCIPQENYKPGKKVICSFLVEALPWNGEFIVMKKQCEDV
ncbi:PREDICTED: cystatin-8-like [Elephantulus edwardii]|uniref:cystatin-8-like n=1 Tax=Elephantulus edwardii TaxID=28737 RepID=UPI0003F07E3A|nr:PREDICTED: cystatin-8-like [Elephantulus edwardii]